MNLSQQEQKDRARQEAEDHQKYSSVTGMRDYQVDNNLKADMESTTAHLGLKSKNAESNDKMSVIKGLHDPDLDTLHKKVKYV